MFGETLCFRHGFTTSGQRSCAASWNGSVILLFLVLVTPARAADWKPIDSQALALKTPRVQADADAEALLWEVRISDELDAGGLTTTYQQYVRIKIFTDRGRDQHATVDIPHASRVRIRDIAARTIRPDGSSVELKKSDVYERTLLKTNDFKVKAYSFALPAVERGAIIEYQWREMHPDSIATDLRLQFSREIPVHSVEYYLKPLETFSPVAMAMLPFNRKFPPLARQKNGFWKLALNDVPAQRDEPYALPALEREPWVYVYYTNRLAPTGKPMWLGFAKALHEAFSRWTQPNDQIRELASEADRGGTAEQRIHALIRAARAKVRRVDVGVIDPEQWRKIREGAKAAEILERGVGTGNDVLVLFLALANAAGFDARVAASPSHALFFHNPEAHPHTSFLSGRLAAVRAGAGWIIVDPGNQYSGRGELRWYHEGEDVLIADSTDIAQARSPVTLAATSIKQRTGTFALSADGTLEGECRIALGGHWGQAARENDEGTAPTERELSLRDSITRRLPGAEVTDVRIEDVDDSSQHVSTFRIRVPGYAQRTGSRLIFRPGVFQRGVEPLFTSPTRSSDVYFPFGWSEEDRITIELPAGYELEQPRSPDGVEAKWARYQVALTARHGSPHLQLRRSFALGAGAALRIAAGNYVPMKKFFDYVHEGDGHTLVLRPAGEK